MIMWVLQKPFSSILDGPQEDNAYSVELTAKSQYERASIKTRPNYTKSAFYQCQVYKKQVCGPVLGENCSKIFTQMEL